MTPEEILHEFEGLTTDLNPKSDPRLKQALFEFLREMWHHETIGCRPDIKDTICSKLAITPALFDIFLDNPPAVNGVENLHRLMKKGWLQEYLEYTIGNEAPEEFHLWVALTVLGSAIKRKVMMDHKFYKIYPNLYTILISPPGVCRKTTSADIGRSILAEAVPDLTIFSEKITPEALAKALSRSHISERPETKGLRIEAKAQGLLFAPELTMFLGREQYNEPLVIFLTRLYDCAKETAYESIKHGKIPLHEVFVALLGCTTPTELPQAIPASASGGGFMSRLTCIYKSSTPRCYPIPVMENPALRELLVIKLRRFSEECEGQFVMSSEGEDWFVPYYMKWKNDVEADGEKSTAQREPYILLKVAMLMNIAEERGFRLDSDVLARAKGILDSASGGARDMSGLIDSNDRGKNQTRIYTFIRKRGGIVQRSAITRYMYGKVRSIKEMDEAIDFLKTAQLIREFRARPPGGVGETTMYSVHSFKEAT